jgi:benzoyl-CoA reductase subunit D
MITSGVDVGTGAVKAAVVDAGRLLATHTERLHRRSPLQVAELAWRRALQKAGVSAADSVYTAATGDGEPASFCDGYFYGMTTHARGAAFLHPGVRAVVDMGALHTRVFVVGAESRVERHRMTSQCASGTGQFLEDIARYLGVRLDDAGPLSLEAARAESCSSICAVLAETDVINMVSRGVPTGEILRGIHESIAQRVVKLLRGVQAESPVVLTGGLSRDVGLRGAIERQLAEEGVTVELVAPPEAQAAGAIGAALWAAVRAHKLAARAQKSADGAA